MIRRDLILGATVLGLLPFLPRTARAEGMINFAPGLVATRLAAGETVFLDFSATWCSTCRAQGRIIESLRQGNAAYDSAMTFVRVDWDQYGRSDFTQSHSIPRRSTLVLLRGEAELGRVVASTREDDIRALMDLALA